MPYSLFLSPLSERLPTFSPSRSSLSLLLSIFSLSLSLPFSLSLSLSLFLLSPLFLPLCNPLNKYSTSLSIACLSMSLSLARLPRVSVPGTSHCSRTSSRLCLGLAALRALCLPPHGLIPPLGDVQHFCCLPAYCNQGSCKIFNFSITLIL